MSEQQTEKTPLKTSEHIVAFIDILGASELIKKNEHSLDIVHCAYSNALKRNEYDFKLKTDRENIPHPNVKIFYNNITVSCAIKEKTSDDTFSPTLIAFYSVVDFCKNFQLELAHRHLLVRGGITKGEFYHGEIMVWGKALLDAHYLESKIAYYPRIILDRQLVVEMGARELSFDLYCQTSMENFKETDFRKTPLLQYFKRDNDFLFYLNYIGKDSSIGELLLKNAITLIKGNEANEEEILHFPKIMWYYNYVRSRTESFIASKIIEESYDPEKLEKATEKKTEGTTEHIVAFIDILGAKELIEEPSSLKTVHAIYKKTINNLKRFNKTSEDYEIKIFSDNILISCPVKEVDDKTKNPYCVPTEIVVFLASAISREFALEGILVRGGITCGEFFCDEVLVWGKALVRAHELESRIAYYPRIIIDSCLLEKTNIIGENVPFLNMVGACLRKDIDELYFCDYILSFVDEPITLINKLLESFKNKQVSIHNMHIYQKQSWYLNYLQNTKYELENPDNYDYDEGFYENER